MPTFVLSVNDLEAAMIHALARGADNHGQALGHVVDLKTPWGRSDAASLDAETFAGLGDTVFLVEINSPQMQERIRNSGREVVVIDHHLYQSKDAGPLDLRTGLSSLEQVINYTRRQPSQRVAALPAYLDISSPGGRKLSFAELTRLISANDRGHIPLLAAEAMKILGLDPRGYAPPKIKHQSSLWDVAELDLAKIGAGWEQRPATWGQDEQKPADWQAMEELVRDIRLRESALGLWLVEGKDIEELALPEVFQRQYRLTADLMDQAINYIACAQGKQKLRLLATGRDEAADPALYLIQAPIRYRKVLLDALYFWRAEQGHSLSERLAALIVFHEDDHEDKPRLLEFYGDDAEGGAVEQWFKPETRSAWGSTRLDFWAGGGSGCFFGAEDRLGAEAEALNALANHILDTVLTGNRPVRKWRTSFLQPLRFCDEELKNKVLDGLRQAASQPQSGLFPVVIGPEERHYFLPHVEPTLAPGFAGQRTEIPELIEMARRGLSIASVERFFEGLCLQLTLPNHPKPHLLPIASVRLHFFYHSVMALEWVIGDAATAEEDQTVGQRDEASENISNEPAEYPPGQPYWRGLLADDGPDALSLAQVLDINAKLRQCYSTYSSDGARGGQTMIRLVERGRILGALLHGGVVNEHRITAWFRALLEKALGLDNDAHAESWLNEKLELLSDDRTRVVSSVIPAGAYPQTPWGRERFEEILARLNTVDPYGQGHFYEPRVAMEELGRGLYERFRANGSLFACTPHSLVFLGFGWFPTDIIHKRHMATMYRRMFLVAMFYQSILHALALSLNEAGRGNGVGPIREHEFKDLRARIIYFTNHLWFRRLSSQVQGVELFDLLSARAGLDQQYQEIADEIERAESFHTAVARQRDESFHRAVAFWGAPLVLFVAMLAIPADGYFDLWGWLARLGQNHVAPWMCVSGDLRWLTLLLGLFFAAALALLPGWLLYLAINKWRGRRKKRRK
ncbi:hypothetical protein Deba_1686 [Desulfarculus baarsii DSM 2075]|uniref:Uncharacterized protein n=2 Tax=Desulfarculus baarsii TaxID=453230 RepID=E1QHL1_DESB2|nr:hypothetical protein Deba_1686 [Desulfarculus baarsii DSM 2075]